MKITTWNINGIRASNKEEPLKKVLDSLGADIICLQETKVTRDLLEESVAIVDGYFAFFSFSTAKGGYSGVATYCRPSATPIAAEEGLSGILTREDNTTTIGCYGKVPDIEDDALLNLDAEGRAILTEHTTQDGAQIVIINVYCPRADRDNEERLTYKLNFYRLLQARCEALLEAGRHVIVLGDINVSHRKIDHCDPDCDPEYFQTNKSRQWIDSLLCTLRKPDGGVKDETDTKTEDSVSDESSKDASIDLPYAQKTASDVADSLPTAHNSDVSGQFVDSFRYFHPKQINAFTCWSTMTGARKTNYGTRIDYIIGCRDLVWSEFQDCRIRPDIMGSDHCPVEAVLRTQFVAAVTLPSICTSLLPEFSGKQQKIKSYFLKTSHNETIGQLMNGGHRGTKRKAHDIKSQGVEKRKVSKEGINVGKKTNLLSFFTKSQTKKSRELPSLQNYEKLPMQVGYESSDADLRCKAPDLPKNCAYNVTLEKNCLSLSEPREGTFQETDSQLKLENLEVCPKDNDAYLSDRLKDRTEATIDDKVISDETERKMHNKTSWRTLFRGPEPPPLCTGHKEPSVLRTVKKEGPNLGKQFYCCARPQGYSTDKEARCNFFVWKKR